MSAITDLEGLLFNDQESVANQLRARMAAGGLTNGWRLTWATRIPGARSWSATEEAAAGDVPLVEAGLQTVMDALHNSIVTRLGVAPLGQIKIRLFEAGEKGRPTLDRTATLSAEDSSASGHYKELYLLTRSDLEQTRLYNLQLLARLADNNTQFANTQIEALKSSSQIASTRTATGAVGDIYGIGGLIGVFLIAVFIPWMRDQLGLPSDTPALQVIDAMQKAITTALPTARKMGLTSARDVDVAPTPPRPHPPEGARAPTAESTAPAPNILDDPNELVLAIKERCVDPEWKARLKLSGLQHNLLAEFA